MNRWKTAFFVVLVMAVASNLYWFAQVVDGAVSYSYLNDSFREEANRFSALGELVVAGSPEYTQADVLHLLRQAEPDAFIVEEENRIHFEGIDFVFEDDRLAAVR